jgi:hypothetical protein
MKRAIQLEHRASSSRSKHEGESSLGLCDRLDRTRDNSQRQLPTDHDYAVPTREYQTDQSSLKPAQAAARSVLGEKQKQRQRQKQPHRLRRVDRVTPYQANALIQNDSFTKRRISIGKRPRAWQFTGALFKWSLTIGSASKGGVVTPTGPELCSCSAGQASIRGPGQFSGSGRA